MTMVETTTAMAAPGGTTGLHTLPAPHGLELSDVILGGQDGLVNVLGIALGVAGKSALIVGTSAVIGSLIPLMPFVLLPVTPAMAASMLVAAVSIFGIGAYKASRTVGRPGRSGLEMALIGTPAHWWVTSSG